MEVLLVIGAGPGPVDGSGVIACVRWGHGVSALGNRRVSSGDAGFPGENWFFCDKSPCPRRNPACPSLPCPWYRDLVPRKWPAVMPDLPAVPDVLPGPLPDLGLPSGLPLDLPAEGRAALAAALDGPLPAEPAAEARGTGTRTVPSRWNDEEITRLRGFLRRWPTAAGGRAVPIRWSTC